MSLANAIERAKKGGHAEPMGLGFEVAELPEVEEGLHLLSELGAWLVSQYPGRIVSWRLQCTQFDSEKPSQRIKREIVLAAEALIQTYRDLSFEVTSPKLPVEADGGNLLLEGWKTGNDFFSLRERGGLLRLVMRLVTNRVVWATPDIRLDTNLSSFREDGVLINIADVSDNRVWSGGLTRGIARVVAKSITPNIELRLGGM